MLDFVCQSAKSQSANELARKTALQFLQAALAQQQSRSPKSYGYVCVTSSTSPYLCPIIAEWALALGYRDLFEKAMASAANSAREDQELGEEMIQFIVRMTDQDSAGNINWEDL